jgi:hypothetical protein
MNITTHTVNNQRIAEVNADEPVITGEEDAAELLGNLYYSDYDRIIIHKKNITPDFFELKNGMAGGILQKFSNYRVRLAIVGDFPQTGGALADFIRESNSGGQVNFMPSTEAALERLGRR